MCYELEREYVRQRAEEARRQLEEERRLQADRQGKPAKEPRQPDPVPV